MAKISRGGGPSDGYAQPGDTATDALGRESALHPEEQGALSLDGERDDSQWLGNNSSPSSESDESTPSKSESDDRAPARTTENLSAPDRTDSSHVRSTVGGTKGSKK